MKNKKGQMFLVAAVIIVGLIFGASRTLNYVSAGSDQESFYDLTEELDFEIKEVLDYGILNDPANTETIALDLLDRYTENIVKEEVIFVFRNTAGEVNAIHYDSAQLLNLVTINVNGNPISIPIQYVYSNILTSAEVARPSNEMVEVRINEVVYNFRLRQGQGFYFVDNFLNNVKIYCVALKSDNLVLIFENYP